MVSKQGTESQQDIEAEIKMLEDPHVKKFIEQNQNRQCLFSDLLSAVCFVLEDNIKALGPDSDSEPEEAFRVKFVLF